MREDSSGCNIKRDLVDRVQPGIGTKKPQAMRFSQSLGTSGLAGAEGLEPSARGFGVDVEERKRERGRGGVARFLLQDENVRCWFGAFRFSRSKTRIESPLEISLRMSSLKSYICMYTEE